MKRISNLIPSIASYDNLCLAYYKAQRGKSTQAEVLAYSKNLSANLQLLQHQILSGNVDIGNYHYFTIHDPKERQICAAAFGERVLHHALMNICHPIFEQHQIFDSYATRPNKGTHKAIAKAQLYQKQYAYYLKMDIRKYFDSIDHHVLQNLLANKFKDPLLLSIFSQIIHSYEVSPLCGIPIGNLSSQYFANHYLSVLDYYIKQDLAIKPYIRYMDDFVVWNNNAQTLHQIADKIIAYAQNKLHLQLKISFINTCKHGLNFLGYRLFPHKIFLATRSKKRFVTKITHLQQLLKKEVITQAQFQQQATSLYAFVNDADSKGFCKKVILSFT